MTHHDDHPVRCVTIDVEEYFHIEAARNAVPVHERDHWPPRVEAAMDLLLDLFARHEIRATFFFLGDVAKRFPHLTQRCQAASHEVASHGMGHEKLHRLTPETFAAALRDTKHLLEDLTGQPVRGYRAPTWSITRRTLWAIDALLEAGFEYDASIFPVRHPGYGVPQAPTKPFMVRGKTQSATLLELPPLTYRLARRNLPAAGGAYFRLLPLTLMKRALAQAAQDRRPAILYFHPWEFDPAQPRMPLSWIGRARTYTGITKTTRRLDTILAQPGTWQPLCDHLDAFRAMAQHGEVFSLGSTAQ